MSKADLLADIRSARTELERVLAAHDERTLSKTALPGQSWTAKELLAHLIGYDRAILRALAQIRAGQPWRWPWTAPHFDEWNESQVAPRRDLAYAAVRAELDESRSLLLAELTDWPDADGPFGPNTWDLKTSAIEWLAPHERDHAGMIAKL